MKNVTLFREVRLRAPLLGVALSGLCLSQAWAQNITTKGTVKDDKGEPLMGVTVRIQGTIRGASTDLDGKFTLSNVPSKATLVLSYVGMQDLIVPLAGKTQLNLVMKSADQELDDVVVVAYGRQKKVNLTGAVSSVDSKALVARPVQNVSQALQGMVPGLNLSVGNSGGELDGTLGINVRGAGTLGEGSNASPLILIDGVEGSMNSVSPSDIESISVLKDASSSAIYGSRAAFGVILITTKGGGSVRKTTFNYNGSLRFSSATQVPDMMDSEMFANYWNAAAHNENGSYKFDELALKRIKAFKYKDSSYLLKDPNNPSLGYVGDYTDANIHEVFYGTEALKSRGGDGWFSLYTGGWANTDWFDYFYDKAAPSTEHNLSVQGGGKKLSYYLSGALLSQRGLLKVAKDQFDRYNFTAKVGAQVNRWLNINYTHRWSRQAYERPTYMTGLFFHNIIRRWPTNAITDPNGYLMPHNEGIQLSEGGRQNQIVDRTNQQLTFVLTPLEGLTIRLENNYNSVYRNTHWSINSIYTHDPNGRPDLVKWDDGRTAFDYSEVHEDSYKMDFFSGRYFAEYAKRLGKHDFKVVGGMDIDMQKYRDLGVTKLGLLSHDFPTVDLTLSEKPKVNGGYWHWSTMGFFGRINYVYDDRYLAEFSIRRDGSSRFINDRTWGIFPSFSLGWNIANEKFFAPLKSTISLLKLRGSWGSLGNSNTTSLHPWFQALRTYTATQTSGTNWLVNGQRQSYSTAPGLVSETLTWERVESWNLGLDFSMLSNRLQGTFDLFSRTTRDMVGPTPPITSLLGTKQPRANNADLRSTGWELELRWRDRIGKLGYGAKLVLSDNMVEVVRYYNVGRQIGTWVEGRPMGEIWGYETVGIAQSQAEMNEHLKKNNQTSLGTNWAEGDIMYRDLNNDGVVNSGKNTYDDHGDLKVIGNTTPRYSYSFTLDASYAGFDASIMLQGIGKRDYIMNGEPTFRGANVGMWQSTGFVEHWDFYRPEGDALGENKGAYYPRPLFDKGGKNFHKQTRWVQNAAYMRIKNVQLGYTLPSSLTTKWGINRLRVYASVDNLATFTSLSKIYDPEGLGGSWGAGKLYPLQRTWSMGLNLNF